ncbi:IpaD/SipD/SspD family type III secretion system needle tip protein [Yersinia mollaretii]|uniref:YspD n=1 Tax=Yersinia mollaretii TaxID=33060 RepID=A0AA36LL17_YERMO|nr:IpaD/SipD/SspD family type III secretion system needle tip protein [Yersinia mollaretii]MDA5537141.1 IpaD/SipD/SspD family type III secretion system needle tip protein [Yersinia mollaretii]NIL05007.1 IpaD/SipD/SspD family type III secretion system needle tip protein [Yersinia mollaretii]CNH89524.1 YspD [Yersinia mollaretii]
MTEAIVTSRPLPLVEGGYAGKTPATQGGNDQGQAIAFQGAEQLTLSASQGDPYLLAEQLLSQNQGLLPSSDSNSYAREFFRSISTDAEEIQDDSRQLHRELQQSTDLYNKANANSAARAASTPDNVGTPPHIDALENLISTIHGDYQKTYSEINQKAAEFMRDVNTALGKISDFIGSGNDGRIRFEVQAFLKNMAKEFSKYATPYTFHGDAVDTHIDKQSVKYFIEWSPDKDHSVKPIYTFTGDVDAATRDFWQKKLGDGFIVKENWDKKIGVFPNLNPIKQIYSSLAHAHVGWDAGGEISSQGFQTLQSAIDSQKNGVNSSVSQLLERFRQDNSTFETLIQLLTKMTEDLHRYNAGYIQ